LDLTRFDAGENSPCRQCDTDDVRQEAILRAFRRFDALQGFAVKAWLLAIVKNRHSTSRLACARAALEARWLQEVDGAPHAMR
jgi:DNA-directed RNA polymerase specialized sigma24 family protein